MRVFSLLLLLLLIALLALVSSPTVAQTVTPTPTGPGYTIIATGLPTYQPTGVPTPGCAAPLPLPLGGSVLLRGGVNVRSAPSLSGPLVNYYDHLVLLRVTRGPVCANDTNWWYVEGNGEPGWVIEGRPGRYFLEAYVDPATTDCSAPLETIQAGGQLQTVTGSRVRAIPSNNADVVTVVQPGQKLTVLDGPRCADHLNWWLVRAPYGTSSTLVDGWIAEGYPTAYYVEGLSASGEPEIACRTALRLHAGSRAAVSYRDGVPRRLRSAPDTSAPVVAELLDGIAFDVISDGAECSGGYNWWHVRILTTGLTGWLAEGLPGNYWFEVLVN